MELSARQPIGPDEVRKIVHLADDVNRNHWITYGYFDISRRLRALIGDHASWCTFSTWSSRAIGQHLRLDEPNPTIERWIRAHPLVVPPVRWALRELGFRLRTRDDAAAPRALAIGNKLVFEEIGLAVTRLIEMLENSRGDDPDEWRAFAATIQGTVGGPLFPSGAIEDLREGLHCYYRARWEPHPEQRAELVLLGNLLIGAYEQARLQPIAEAALSPYARRLVELAEPTLDALTRAEARAPAALEPPARPWALQAESPLLRRLAHAYAGVLTRFLMTIELPRDGSDMEVLSIAAGLPRPAPGEPLYEPPLDRLRNPLLREVLARYDTSGGTPEGCGARNWIVFEERMNYIANVFRARQGRRAMHRTLPLSDLLPLSLGEPELDGLRMIGDDQADAKVRRFVAETGLSPRDFVAVLVRYGLGPAEIRRGCEACNVSRTLASSAVNRFYPGAQSLPRWADPSKLRDGQRFFQEFGLEIASSLFTASLPMSYTSARGTRVLTEAGGLAANAERRIAETGQMLLDVMGSDDPTLPPLSPATRGYHAARGVRLFHAAVRHWILEDPTKEWDLRRLGVPINQEDLLGTLAAFTVVVIESLEKMGVSVSERQRDAYLHLWLVVGHLMGIDYEQLYPHPLAGDVQPLRYREMRLLRDEILRRNAAESRDGRQLMGELLRVMESAVPRFGALTRALTRYLIGTRYADMLGVEPAGWGDAVVGVLRPVAWAITPIKRVGPFGSLADGITRNMYGFWIRTHRGDRPSWRLDLAREQWDVGAHRPARSATTAGPYSP